MYFKVASVLFLSVFFSGCSMFSNPKPKKPAVKVVEEIDNNVSTTMAPKPVVSVEKVKKPITTLSKEEKKYKLKPEPFSLESNENDPELLGPQTTIDRGLNDTKESNNDTKNKVKDAKSVTTDEKKEAL